MMYYSGLILFLLAFMLKIQGFMCGSTCYERQYNYFTSGYYYTYYDYCTYGCCGYTTYRYCCSYYNGYDAYTSVSVSIGVIIGSVIGGIVFLGVLISVVVCCICKCADNRRPNRGAVVAPTTVGAPGVSIVHSNVTMPPRQNYPMYSHPIPAAQPPSYNNTQGLNPGYVPAAYPPPPAYPPPAYPPPPRNPATAPVEQPDNDSTPFAPTDSAQSAWNTVPPAATH
ncbi:cysteine and tyrosine-rich protein 1-like [Pecten maximus]|uniref:cysteine and tyrosine-rich protein 1-like n=1 Tax=Pecten maximus TaxID=6579 RepID=UPI001457E82B|nr:cysteine and tyrosine-rich protein 1-like [Pecten maximus]